MKLKGFLRRSAKPFGVAPAFRTARGGADFIAEIISGRVADVNAIAWNKGREKEIETAFVLDEDKTDLSKWGYNKHAEGGETRGAELPRGRPFRGTKVDGSTPTGGESPDGAQLLSPPLRRYAEQSSHTLLEAILDGIDTPVAKGLGEPRESAGGELGRGEFEVYRRIGCCLAKCVTEHEVIQHREQRDLLFGGHRGFSQRLETLLHVAEGVEPGRSRQHRYQRPRVTDIQSARIPGDLHHRTLPVFWKGRQEGFAHERIVHNCDQIVFGLNVVIKAHRPDFELLRHAAH
jgi:hypothetical protein